MTSDRPKPQPRLPKQPGYLAGWRTRCGGPIGCSPATARAREGGKCGERDLGVDQFAVYDMHDAEEATIDAYGAHVIPALR